MFTTGCSETSKIKSLSLGTLPHSREGDNHTDNYETKVRVTWKTQACKVITCAEYTVIKGMVHIWNVTKTDFPWPAS